jgi:hypothetical protein
MRSDAIGQSAIADEFLREANRNGIDVDADAVHRWESSGVFPLASFSSSVSRSPTRRHRRAACGPGSAILMRVSLPRTFCSRVPGNVRNSVLEPSGRFTSGGRPEAMLIYSMRGPAYPCAPGRCDSLAIVLLSLEP